MKTENQDVRSLLETLTKSASCAQELLDRCAKEAQSTESYKKTMEKHDFTGFMKCYKEMIADESGFDLESFLRMHQTYVHIAFMAAKTSPNIPFSIPTPPRVEGFIEKLTMDDVAEILYMLQVYMLLSIYTKKMLEKISN